MRNFVDQEVALALSTPQDNLKVKCSVSSELMEYQLPGELLDVSAEHPVNAAQDDAGYPIIFAVMKDRHLYAVLRVNDMQTGWSAINLTAKMGRGAVNTYAVSQNQAGKITLAVSLIEQDNHSLWVTDSISNEAANTRVWGDLAWHARPDAAPHKIRSIHLGTDDDAKGYPLMIVATSDRQGVDLAQHYAVKSNPGETRDVWDLFPIPENTEEIIDIAVGSHALGRGVYNLYKADGQLSLLFISVKNQHGTTANVELPVPQNARSVDALPAGRDGHTDLYVGGDGIYLIPKIYQRSKYKDMKYVTVLAGPDEAPGVQEIIVRDDSETVSVWGLDRDRQLQYVKGTKGANYASTDYDEGRELPEASGEDHSSWEKPLVLRRGVERLAPIRNRRLHANTVLLKGGDNRMVQMTQAPRSNLWTHLDIPLPDDGRVQNVKAYVTQLHIAKEDGSPYLPDIEDRLARAQSDSAELEPRLKFRLTASDLAQVEVNGKSYTVSATESVEVLPDSQGSITLISRTGGLETPFFYLDSSALADRVVINPATKVNDGLRSINDEADLKNVTLRDGRPLVDPAYHKNVAGAVKGLKDFNRVADDLPKDGGVSSEYLPLMGDEAAAWDSAFGMSYSPEEGLRHFGGGDAFAMMERAVARDIPRLAGSDDWFWRAVTRAAGDLIEWAKNTLIEAFEFVVRQAGRAWQFALKIGEAVYKFTIECLGHVYSAANWLLKKTLGIDLDKLIEWLGFFFDWDDIQGTKKAFSSIINYTLEFGEKQVGRLEGQVEGFFNEVIRRVREERSAVGGQPGVRTGLQQAAQSKQETAPPESFKAVEFATKSPGGNFGNFLMKNGNLSGPAMFNFSLPAAEAIRANDALNRFFNETVIPLVSEIEESAGKIGDDFKSLFTGGGLTVEKALETLGSESVVIILNVAKRIVLGVLKVAEEAISLLKKLLNAEINLPFVSALYRQVTGSEKMTLLDIFSLVFAIPTTTFYKLLKGRAPFGKDGGPIAAMGMAGFFKTLQDYESGAYSTEAEAAQAADVVKIYSWVGGVASALLYHIQSSMSLVATCLETKIPAAIDSPFCLFNIALTIPFGRWSISNVAGWAPTWILMVKNLYDICFPEESKAGHIMKIVIALLKGVGNGAKFIYTVVTQHSKPVVIAYAVWKAIEDVVDCISSTLSGVSGLLPPGDPYGTKYIVAVIGAGGHGLRTRSALVRAGASVITDNVLVSS